MQTQKKHYEAPLLMVHGDVAELTRAGNAGNHDPDGGIAPNMDKT